MKWADTEKQNRFTLRDAPQSAGAIGKLGAKHPQGADGTRREKFQVLMFSAGATAEARGWNSYPGDVCEFYAKEGPSTLAKQVWLSPTMERMRIKVTPVSTSTLPAILLRLNAGVPGLRFAEFRDHDKIMKAQATIALGEFFGGRVGAEAMSERFTDVLTAVLDAVDDRQSATSPDTTPSLESSTRDSSDWASRLPSAGDIDVLERRLDDLAALDLPSTVLRRAEQGLLRSLLLVGRTSATCSLCARELPVDLLVLAHIKPRSQSSDTERRDYTNNTMLACSLGCDELFERHYIEVHDGKTVEGARKPETSDAQRVTAGLLGKSCSAWREASAQYFDWHSGAPQPSL